MQDPDAFFARFGHRKFRSRLDAADLFHQHLHNDPRHFSDAQQRERDAEEQRILREVREQLRRSPFPVPTFEQLNRMERERRMMERQHNFKNWGSVLLVCAVFGLLVSTR